MGKYIKHPLTKIFFFFLSTSGANPYRPSRVFFHSIRTINRLPRFRAIASQNFANNILNSSKRYKFGMFEFSLLLPQLSADSKSAIANDIFVGFTDSSLADIHNLPYCTLRTVFYKTYK